MGALQSGTSSIYLVVTDGWHDVPESRTPKRNMPELDRAESSESKQLDTHPSEAMSDILRETYGPKASATRNGIATDADVSSLPEIELFDGSDTGVSDVASITAGDTFGNTTTLDNNNDAFLTEQGTMQPNELGTTEHYCLTVDGIERQFDVYVPKGYDGKTPMPVVYLLAGVTGEGDQPGFMPGDTGMNQKADEVGMIVVYPYAQSVAMPVVPLPPRVDSWNSPGAGLVQPRSEYDDVNYLSAVIAQVNGNYNIDKQAEFIAGFSEGGEMAQHLQARLGTFEAVASVHGTLLGTEAILEDDPDKAVAPALIILGDHDSSLPHQGGRGIMTIHLPRVDQSKPMLQLPVWADANECSGEPNIVDTDDQTITEYTAEQCSGMQVVEILRKGGQHAWDGPYGAGWPFVGEKDRHFNTTDVVVDFFLDQLAR